MADKICCFDHHIPNREWIKDIISNDADSIERILMRSNKSRRYDLLHKKLEAAPERKETKHNIEL